ncbi:MAG: hypothetical protein U0Q55_17165 [Vicinamibacterales bacterium]
MLSRRSVLMLLLLGAAPAALTAAPRETMSAVSIRIHDYSGFDEQQLQQAQRQVSDTYSRIRVRLDWRALVRPAEIEAGLQAWPDDPQATMTIVVLSGEMAARLRVPEQVAGYAPITRERGGRIAFVVGPRTRAIAEDGRVAPSQVLAGIISHEVAHLLMPDRSHSPIGLMRAHWTPAEFRLIQQRHFSPAEGSAIRQSLRLIDGGPSRVAD